MTAERNSLCSCTHGAEPLQRDASKEEPTEPGSEQYSHCPLGPVQFYRLTPLPPAGTSTGSSWISDRKQRTQNFPVYEHDDTPTPGRGPSSTQFSSAQNSEPKQVLLWPAGLDELPPLLFKLAAPLVAAPLSGVLTFFLFALSFRAGSERRSQLQTNIWQQLLNKGFDVLSSTQSVAALKVLYDPAHALDSRQDYGSIPTDLEKADPSIRNILTVLKFQGSH